MKEQNDKSEPQLSKAYAVKKEFEAELRKKANVTGVGVGYKVIDGRITEQVSVRVYVSKKVSEQILGKGDLIPKTINGVPLDVIEAEFVVHQDPSIPEDHRLRFNPLIGGISIGSLTLRNSGTLGGSVFDNELGEDMILSNWHVLCGRFTCTPGESIIQPGLGGGDTGGPGDIVARLHRAVLTDEVDCATARLTGNRFLLKRIFGRGPVTNVAEPRLGMAVRKSGRTSGLTSGMITDESADVMVEYPDGIRSFRNQVIIEGGTNLSLRGDSGSIWIDSSNRAVALNFAGSSARALANPMPLVLTALDINVRAGITMQDFVAITYNTLL